MKNIWSVFTFDESNLVNMMELRTILRALDIDPNEDELNYLIK
jgi:Ca2+-binding EF-hand superfamily protein